MTLQRYYGRKMVLTDGPHGWCDGTEVAELEAKVAELESDMDAPFEIDVTGKDGNGPEVFNRRAVARVNAFRRALGGHEGEPRSDAELLKSVGGLRARVAELETRQTVCPECGKAQQGRLKILRSHPPAARCQHCGFVAWTRSRGVEMVRPDQPEKEKSNGRD